MKDRKVSRRLVWLLAATLLALVSCGPSYNFSGTWTGRREVSGPNAAIAEGLSRIRLTVTTDGKFELLQFGATYSGSTRTDDGKMMLQVKEMLGKPILRQSQGYPELKLTPIDQNSVEFVDPGQKDADRIVLRRESQP